MSFSGLLPETINGRAAMIGMLAAFGAEVGTRQPVFQQVSSSHWSSCPLSISALSSARDACTCCSQVIVVLSCNTARPRGLANEACKPSLCMTLSLVVDYS